MQEFPDRRVDREGAHHIVQLPIVVRLQPVVTIDAAALAGNRWVYRSEDLFLADRQELRDRGRIGPADERLDRRRHFRVRWRRRDRASGPADPAQPERIARTACPVEELDRVSPECRRDRGAFAPEIPPQIRIVADKRVDQLERGPLFIGLVFNVGVQTHFVEAETRDDRQHGREGDDHDPPETLSRFQEGDCGSAPCQWFALVWGPAW